MERPTSTHRTVPAPYRQYPKKLTTDSGGLKLGRYLRSRMGISPTKKVTYKDLQKYGHDYVTFTMTIDGTYEMDFSI